LTLRGNQGVGADAAAEVKNGLAGSIRASEKWVGDGGGASHAGVGNPEVLRLRVVEVLHPARLVEGGGRGVRRD
jgi:hypothetical protein